MDPARLASLSQAAQAAAQSAGQIALDFFSKREELAIEKKGPQDLVSRADREVEEYLVKTLAVEDRSFGFLAEETHPLPDDLSNPMWIIDPIDGTTNFLRGLPAWCISIALWEEGRTVLGVIYDPVGKELFTAVRGQGAFVGARRMRCSHTTSLTEAVVAIGRSRRVPDEAILRALDRLTTEGAAFRKMGSAALASTYVAAGRVDAYLEMHLNAWDMAAVACLIEEAGGKVNTGFDEAVLKDGGPFLAAAPDLFGPLLALSGISGI